MPRKCLACSHPDRAAIDKALVAGEPLRDIARRVSISKDGLARHRSHVAGPTRSATAVGDGDAKTTPDNVIGVKSFSSLPPKKQKYIEGLAEGKTKVQAALAAGYSEAMARSAAHSIETNEVRTAFAELMRKRIPPEKIVQRIDEGMDALETKFFQKDGKVQETVDVVAWSERREYTELAAEYGGYFAPRDDGGNTNVGIAVTVETMGAEPSGYVEHTGQPIEIEAVSAPSDGDETVPVAPAPSDETEGRPSQSSPQPSSSTVPLPPASQSKGFAIMPPGPPRRGIPLTRTGAAMAFLRGGGSR